MTESATGLYKADLVRDRGPWRGLDDLELATLEWVDWFIHRRLHSEIVVVPPAEYEANHYHQNLSAELAETIDASLKESRGQLGHRPPYPLVKPRLCAHAAASVRLVQPLLSRMARI